MAASSHTDEQTGSNSSIPKFQRRLLGITWKDMSEKRRDQEDSVAEIRARY